MVVDAGDTDVLPFVDTGPTPGEILADLAFSVLHVNVELPPGLMLNGEAVNCTICTPEPCTVTVAVSLCELFPRVAVSLYVVVCVGDTVEVPISGTLPMPVISTVSAFFTSQIKVEL